MLKLLLNLLKLSLFAVLVLVVAHYVKVEGRSISDQVDTHIARAERAPVIKEVKNWTSRTAAALKHDRASGSTKGRSTEDSTEANPEERQELRKLLGN